MAPVLPSPVLLQLTPVPGTFGLHRQRRRPRGPLPAVQPFLAEFLWSSSRLLGGFLTQAPPPPMNHTATSPILKPSPLSFYFPTSPPPTGPTQMPASAFAHVLLPLRGALTVASGCAECLNGLHHASPWEYNQGKKIRVLLSLGLHSKGQSVSL